MSINTEKIKIKYHADIDRLAKISIGDWIDLRAAEEVTIDPFKMKMISLGISMELPEGYEAHILPRSSTYKNYGVMLVNGMGIIDNSYCGDMDIWQFPAINLSDSATTIAKNDRIAQFRIVRKQPEIEFIEVEELLGPSRGGFGSTGVR